MSQIEVRCICGKSYHVPPDKAGRRLQCRRCGNVQRIPRPGQGSEPSAGEPLRLRDDPQDGPDTRSSSTRPGAPSETQPRARSAREARSPLRRCPACGLQDEPGVVICVRCGYDWRTGKRLRDAQQNQGGEDDLDLAAEAAQEDTERLGSLSWLALSPAGVLVGPYIVWRSREIEARLRRLRRHEATGALRQIRLTAMSGAALWLVVLILLGVLVSTRTSRSAAEVSQQCRQRLETAGRLLRAKVEESGEFPTGGQSLTDGLRELLEGAGQGRLVCPAHDGLHPYRVASVELLTREASPQALIAWDQEPHLDEVGRPAYRALRFDGTVEAFPDKAGLRAATRRPVFPQLDNGGGPVAQPTAPGPQPTPSGGSGPAKLADVQRQVTRLLAFAYECDDEDPDLNGELSISRETFLQRLGLTPEQLLPLVLGADDPKVRLPAARLTARLSLPAPKVKALLEPLAGDPQVQVRLVVGLVRRAQGNPAWLPLLCEVAEAGDPTARERALQLLGAAAEGAPAETKRILEQARALRIRSGAQGDEAIFPLPAGALPNAVALLDDRSLGREAKAVLYSAGTAALAPLHAGLQDAPPQREGAILQALDLLRRAELLTLADFLADLDLVGDPSAQLAGLEGLLREEGPPPPALSAWVLDRLRGGLSDRNLSKALSRFLTRLPGGDLVDALVQDGDHAAVMTSLQRRERLGDASLDARLAEVWQDLPDLRIRTTLTSWLRMRPHEESLLALLQAMQDEDEGVRRIAAQTVSTTEALRSRRVRAKISKVLSQRLSKEESVTVRDHLYRLARDPINCSTRDDEHVCTNSLIKVLRAQARKEDVRAIRALSTHANAKVAGVLLRLLDGASELRMREELAGALRAVTGSNELPQGADFWKAMLRDNRKTYEAFQLDRWQTTWGHFQRRQERTQRQLDQLQGGNR